MIIDKTNCNIINTKDVYIHDAIFKGIDYDYSNKKLSVKYLISFAEKSIKNIEFYNVKAFKMIVCDCWGKSPHIFDWENIDRSEGSLINEIHKVNDKQEDNFSTLCDKEKDFETVITLSSGNKLTVVCEYIVFDNQGNTWDG